MESEKIKLPEISYTEKLTYFIKKCPKPNDSMTESIRLEGDPLIGKFFKFTGNGHNPNWGWIGLENADQDTLEKIYLKLYNQK